MSRKRRLAALMLAFWSAIFAGPGFVLWREYHQQELNRRLLTSIKHGDTASALLALKDGANPNVRDEPAISPLQRIWQLVRGHRQATSPLPVPPTPLQLLLEYDCWPRDNGTRQENPPAEHAGLVEALIAHGANVDVPIGKFSPLMFALNDPRKIATARLLIEHGANVTDGRGEGYLISAIMDGDDVSIIELMLEHGADPNRNVNGATPLGIALLKKNRAAVACLLAHNADPNLPIWSPGWPEAMPPLWYAEKFLPEIATMLRRAGARRLDPMKSSVRDLDSGRR